MDLTALEVTLALLAACGNLVSGVPLSLIPISRAQGALVWKHLLLRRLGLSLSQTRLNPFLFFQCRSGSNFFRAPA